ncbi:hypothetical protein J1605_021323 [Eschrichtius robustus]|uniref:S phase cyclin A-associated protein in the endoplasmic reticulum N-terminal domain-containing protein n=1 Tax=Eschrichtius robustus TaxID=9764 RepID=A0AB34HEU9_ESCRO|nr:hypothetical protein J1605_021323 [Eschrichtius robustus]
MTGSAIFLKRESFKSPIRDLWKGTMVGQLMNTTVDCKITSSTTGDKHFDKSPTKTRHPRKIDLRARYWAFLFDNLRRAVDEIYVTCESDQSVVECKLLKPACLEPVLRNKRSHHNEKPMHRNKE